LVIEVLSPSNTPLQIREKAALCLSNGAKEFWVVDPQKKTVTVMRNREGTTVYPAGEEIPLALLDVKISTAHIFD
jgi:Uma2 family endonuclease